MIDFKEFEQHHQQHVQKMLQGDNLFVVDIDKDILWNLYLDSFPEGTNPVFRERRAFDCSCCRQYVKDFGNVVAITPDNKIISIWDFDAHDENYQVVVDALSEYVHSATIKDVFFYYQENVSSPQTFEEVDEFVTVWQHFSTKLPQKFIRNGTYINKDRASVRDSKNVLARSFEEFTKESILVLSELLASDALYRGNTYLLNFQAFSRFYDKYHKIESANEKDAFLWNIVTGKNKNVFTIWNSSIGMLLKDISSGMGLDEAVRRYDQAVAPANYQRPSAPISITMVRNAEKTVDELGLKDSLERRHAMLSDIALENLLFVNRQVNPQLETDVFGELKSSLPTSPKKFNKVAEISAEQFLQKIVPDAKELEVFVERRISPNFVALTTSANKNSQSLFSWGNSFGWTYTGNVADSNITKNVALAGGQIKGVLRCSLMWNDGKNEFDGNDYDLHAIEPNNKEIYYMNKRQVHKSSGMLDVDVISPTKGKPAVENIVYTDKNSMLEGKYTFFVNVYSKRTTSRGFSVEIMIENEELHTFRYDGPLNRGDNVMVAEVFLKNGKFEVAPKIYSKNTSKVWNVQTETFVPVRAMMFSPNHWEKNKGEKHVIFILNECRADEELRGFFNEFLDPKLRQHRKVFEVLGNKMIVEPTEDRGQLAGVGFTANRDQYVFVKVKGATERIFKVKF